MYVTSSIFKYTVYYLYCTYESSRLVGKEPTYSAGGAGDMGLMPGLGRSSKGGQAAPTPVFLPGELHGQRSLAG